MRSSSIRSGAIAVIAMMLVTAGGARAAEPIRVGFIGPLTGLFAQAGKDMVDGLKLAFEQVGYQAAGRKIELIEEDDQGSPATALAKYRKLADQDHIHILAGILLVNIGYGLVQPIERDKLPTLYLTTPDDLTKRRLTKSIVRITVSASQPMHPFGEYAAKILKYRKVAAVAMDNDGVAVLDVEGRRVPQAPRVHARRSAGEALSAAPERSDTRTSNPEVGPRSQGRPCGFPVLHPRLVQQGSAALIPLGYPLRKFGRPPRRPLSEVTFADRRGRATGW